MAVKMEGLRELQLRSKQRVEELRKTRFRRTFLRHSMDYDNERSRESRLIRLGSEHFQRVRIIPYNDGRGQTAVRLLKRGTG